MSASAARTVAFEVVKRVRERSAYAHETLASVLTAHKLDSRDSAFATRLAYGAVACRGTLEEAVARFTAGKSLEPVVLDALCVATYELLYARTPARAAVSEGVELVRAVQPKAAGLANAVLRRIAEQAVDFPWGDPDTDITALARLHGHPEWLAAMWAEQLGIETAAAVMAADNEPAPLYLAHLPFGGAFETVVDELTSEGAETSECGVPGCLVAASPSAAVNSGPLARRSVIVADAAAQLAAACVPLPQGGTVVEIGAGRGTKAMMLAGRSHLLGNEATIVAVDNHDFKLKALSKAATEIGIRTIRTVCADATLTDGPMSTLASSAYSVLVDAPCSGLGTLRRHPDRRWRALPSEIPVLAELGLKLLQGAASLVSPGGFVVYSTCTVARDENQDVIEGFLASSAGASFVLDSLAADVPEQWRKFVTPTGMFQSLPEIGGPDGHFIARLKRTS